MSARTRPRKLAAPLLAVLALWRGQTAGLALGVVVSVLALLFGLALLAVSGLRLAGTTVGLLLVSGWLLRGFGTGRVVLRYGERLLTHGATFRALADLRVWFFRRLAASAAGGLGFRRTGDALSRLVGDVEALDGLYLRLLLPLCGALVSLPVLALLIGRSAPILALVVCLLFAASALLLPWLAARRSARIGGTTAEAMAGLRIAILDTITGLREFRAFGAERRTLAGVEACEGRLLSAQAGLARQSAAAGAGAFLCSQAAVLCVLAAAAGIGFARLPPLTAVLVLFVMLAAFEAASGLVRAGVLAGHMAHAASRVLQIGDHPLPAQARTTPAPGLAPMPADMSVRFDAIRFAWSEQPARAPVFDGLSLRIPPGARVGLLGPSGSGKSSLAALLLRIATPQSGQISIGGIDIARLDEATLRRSIAWLGQDSHLFDDSIRNNLALGRPDASEAELWSALEQAQIADLVRGLPDGLDSWLGESGARVSGGQGRRLALARVLLSAAPILILDEPCAGLDADTERAFLATLNEVGRDRSMILILHRLTGVERLDRVWRLQDGKALATA
ncbi:thiol reductant ABC exporter subunit CydC [Lichenicoccus sp.]|uniref:thiol reductant ABC exporter subunit CydC n=1 Tax=Lichenicoccus sp. TaxID=2781899 RepID=UPI003D14BD83